MRAGDHLRRLAAARRWKVGVIAGAPRAAESLLDVLREAGVATGLVQRDFAQLSPPRLLEELAPALDAANASHDLELVRRTRDAAAAGERGAAGLEPVLAALEQGLVERLLLDGDHPVLGAIAEDGRLVPPSGDLPADTQFADRLALRAVETAASTTVVGGAAAAMLGEVGGVAAILRSRAAPSRII